MTREDTYQPSHCLSEVTPPEEVKFSIVYYLVASILSIPRSGFNILFPHDTVGLFSQEQILGIGRTGLVVHPRGLAIKLPLEWSISIDKEVEADIEYFQHERSICKCPEKLSSLH